MVEVSMYDALLQKGHTYFHTDGKKYIEFHMDTIVNDVFSSLHQIMYAAEKEKYFFRGSCSATKESYVCGYLHPKGKSHTKWPLHIQTATSNRWQFESADH